MHHTLESQLLNAFLQQSTDEVYLFNADNFCLEQASDCVISRLKLNRASLHKHNVETLLGLSKQAIVNLVGGKIITIDDNSLNTTTFVAHGEFKIAYIHASQQSYFLAIKKQYAPTNAQTSQDNESRFKALVANTPGLVVEFQLNKQNEISFSYLSDRCEALLGVPAEALLQAPKKFFAMMEKDDRDLFKSSLYLSAKTFDLLNWEGRFWIESWKDTKWVNLRAVPRLLAGGEILWEGYMTNITQSKREKFELQESRKMLAELSAHLDHVKEEERKSIAREIHDDLGGNLTAIKIGLGSMLKKLTDEQQLLIEKAKNLEMIVDSTFESAHRISANLRPVILELGIVSSLEWQAKEFEKQLQIPCQFVCNKKEGNETKEQAIALFRICQEAMSNIAKHAKAKHVKVSLFFDKQQIKLEILDDGLGIRPEDKMKSNSFGLRGMSERVAALNGEFSIEQLSTTGTLVTVILPILSKKKVLN